MSEFDYSKLEFYGEDVYISGNVVIKRPHLVSVGSHVAIDDYLYTTVRMSIGSYVHVAPMCTFIGGEGGWMWMGNFTTIAAGCRIIVRGDEHLGEGLVSPVIPEQYRDEVIGYQITMEDYSSLGSNVVLMPNVWLAQGVVVGAGAVVTKPIEEPWTIWAGVPARKIKDRPREKMLEYGRILMSHE